jgi:uncharacterized protein DUF3352
MHRRSPFGSRALPAALIALLAAFALAGCGSSGGAAAPAGGGPDPATLAPADAALYGQAVVKPSGAMKAGVLAASRKVLRVADPGARLARLLDAADRSGHVSFERDVEPWLGQRVGGFLLTPSRGARHPDWAIAVAIADRGAFDAALPRLRRDGHERPAGSYRGVAYQRDASDDTYDAPVGDFYVSGTRAGLRAAIDAWKGDSLAGASRFTAAVRDVPADALALLYLDPRALAVALQRGAAAGAMLARLAAAQPVVASLTATADRVTLDATGGSLAPGGGAASGAQVSVGQLPGDAWLALATPPLGPLIRSVLTGAGLHDLAAAQVRRRLGLDLDRDLLDPLGGLGAFARGTDPLDLGGGALVQMTDAVSAQRLLTRVEGIVAAGFHLAPQPFAAGAARGFQVQVAPAPEPIVVATKGDKLAAGYGAASAQDLFAPQQRFGDSGAGKAAIATLGDGYTPSFVLLVPQLAALLRSLDAIQVANLSPVLPYLSGYRSLAIGTKRDGDRTSVRIVAALR